MTFLERQHELRTKQLANLYDPKTAFGNLELLKLNERLQEDKDYIKSHKVCRDCKGSGTEECGECGADKDCTTCKGEGYLPKS